jgi:2-desacetyl-2-hydroxyethyl bacteriochlorophyllide A dehydrogenase
MEKKGYMKTLVIDKPRSVTVTERGRPAAGKNELLVRMAYAGFCGSDLNTYLGRNPMVQYPRVPGHEISGVIEGIGEEVPEGFAEGEAITVIPYTSCGRCPACRRGRSHACRYNRTLGVQRDGAMQEYIAVPWEKALKAPKLSLRELALAEPLTVGFHAVARGRVNNSDTVMVLGCGMIGAGAIAGAVARGAEVIAVDIDDHKLQLARMLGAAQTINTAETGLHERVAALTSGDGPDVVVEAAGKPATYLAAVDEVAYTGRVVCIGYAAEEVRFETPLFVKKELDILGSRNAAPEDFRAVIAYLEGGGFPLEHMITGIIRPEQAAEALAAWADDPGKVMKLMLGF